MKTFIKKVFSFFEKKSAPVSAAPVEQIAEPVTKPLVKPASTKRKPAPKTPAPVQKPAGNPKNRKRATPRKKVPHVRNG